MRTGPRRDRAALLRALGRYDQAPLLVQVFVRGRAFLSDLPFVEGYVPKQGFVVDLGCGHGLFANLLVEASPRRRVLGVDSDARKIAAAKWTEHEGLRFELGDVVSEPPPPCDCVSIVDVLYLLPFEEQEKVLEHCAAALPEGGLVIAKAQEARADPRYLLTYGQELVTTRLGLTGGARGRFYFAERDEALAMFGRAGFAAEAIDMPGRPYTDVLYIGRRKPR